ncbi:hypothetical protein L209DRAFT_610844 [Thermothelomyces heterothallicus CBS 203.75]
MKTGYVAWRGDSPPLSGPSGGSDRNEAIVLACAEGRERRNRPWGEREREHARWRCVVCWFWEAGISMSPLFLFSFLFFALCFLFFVLFSSGFSDADKVFGFVYRSPSYFNYLPTYLPTYFPT